MVEPSVATTPVRRKPRDVRLDFFRGVCLIIIFIAHVWNNPWTNYIPARFGFSDATEIFVFCSGMASALAFGSVFVKRGVLIGSARIAFRCWQVYWSHIGTFLVAAALTVAADRLLRTGGTYVDGLELTPAFGENARDALLGLLTLTYVPHYFDILPMYLVILAMIPIVMALAARDKSYAAAFIVACWLGGSLGLLDLPAEPWGDRPWFFNPFCWQLVFFTGFALMSGWLPAPPVDGRLIRVAAAVLVVSLPFAWVRLWENVEVLRAGRDVLEPLINKTRFGILRYAHFLSLAYLAYVAVGEGGRRLQGPVVDLLRRLGQQSLAVFMSGLVLSFLASTALNLTGRTMFTVALVNIAGILALFAVARVAGWFKSQPWQQKDEQSSRSTARASAASPDVPTVAVATKTAENERNHVPGHGGLGAPSAG